MSASLIAWLGGLALLFAGQRLFGGQATFELVLSFVGIALAVASVAIRVQARKAAPGPHGAAAHRTALILQGVGFAALVLYFASDDSAADALGLSEEGIKRWTVSLSALWPILLLVASFPLVLIDLAIEDSPLAVQPLRIKQALNNGLIVALGTALVFPVNFLASETNERWDLAYFRTTDPGTATVALVSNLTEPVVVRVFQPTSSDVSAELRVYFDQLVSHNDLFTVEYVDHAAEPVLSERLKVRDNGYIALTSNDGTDDEVTKTWKVGDDLDKSKRNLSKLDEEFQKRLLELAKGERVAYFTVGHGELNWKTDVDALPDDKISGLKSALQNLNFKVKELGLAEGLGSEVPDDASLVFVLGPTQDLMEGESNALNAYLDRGGAVLIAAEPGTTATAPVLEHLGLKLGEGRLATKAILLRRTGDKLDRINLATNRYSSHESTSTLSRLSRQMPLFLVGSGYLEETEGHRGKVTITVRSLPDVFADLDGDLELGDGEKEDIRPLAAVASGPSTAVDDEGNPVEYRALITADAQVFSDVTIANAANQQYIFDGVNWLIGEEELAGTIESEEDVKIEHTQEDQVAWFYMTVLLLPGLVLVLGVARVRGRKRKSRVRASGGVA